MDASSYQRFRLWSGITSIGFNLGLVWGLFVFALFSGAGSWPAIAQCLALVGCAVFLQAANLPLDILVGQAAETVLARTHAGFRQWFHEWLASRVLVGSALAAGLVFFWLASRGGVEAGAILVAATVVLAGLLRLPGGREGTETERGFGEKIRRELERLGCEPVEIRWFAADDSAPLNGMTHPFERGVVQLSDAVPQHLTPREAALMVAREDWMQRSGFTRASAGIASGWLLCGVALALLLPFPDAFAGALGGAAVVTTWCFLALFVWPPVNRRWMHAADRWLAGLVPREEVRAVLEKIQAVNATDTELPPAKTNVFHPIPPLHDRTALLS